MSNLIENLDGSDAEEENDLETIYVPITEEEFGKAGGQVEVLADENKSLIWSIIKQVRPGMDLSKVVLPTFILEPRSFLDKLSDSYYHADILSRAVSEDDPFTRMRYVVQWYLSGFYKKPKGLKKPYNPILGETFRCYWQHENGCRTYYIAEQVSHHPPISAFYVTNRQEGFSISCSILAKSKFYGNSTTALLEGVATLTILPRGETYSFNTPYAHCKGILVGALSMEFGGKVNIECEYTGYRAEIEFKLKPFIGGSDFTNLVMGKIKLGSETLASINGHWDTEIRIKDGMSEEETVLFAADIETKKKRLIRYVVPIESQLPNESERLWRLVSEAIGRNDQVGATEEKSVLEDAQRLETIERKVLFQDWHPRHFRQDVISGKWIYKHSDLRPWDPRTDVRQYESGYKVLTKTRIAAPTVPTESIVDLLREPRWMRAVNSGFNEEPLTSTASSKGIGRLALKIDHLNKAIEDHKRQLNLLNSKIERLQNSPQWHSSTSKIFDDDSHSSTQATVIKYTLLSVCIIAITFLFKWIMNK